MQQEGEEYKKLNAFSRRPCATQIISYCMIIAVNTIFWVLMQDKFISQNRRFLMTVLFTMSVVVLLIVGFITSYIDPSDPFIKEQSGNRKSINFKLNLEKFLYCEHCRTYVCVTSRHCKQCDRCISRFDHHCIWINSCIGQINYKPFFVMICSAFIHLFLFLVSLALLWSENNWQIYLSQIIVTWILGVVVLIFLFLLLALIILHIFLMYNQMTTFDYILSKKTQEERKKFTNIIRVKIEQIKEPEQPVGRLKPVNNNQNLKTQNQLPLPSAFQQIHHNMSDDKSDTPSFECFKQKKQKKSPQILTPQKFESILIEKSKVDDKEQQNIKSALKNHRSLKALIGGSINIKKRKESLHEFSPKSQQSRRSNVSINVSKVDDFIYYLKEGQKIRKSQQKQCV